MVDFSAFAGGEHTVRGADCRLVLAGPRFGINAALMVTRMQGLRNARDLNPVTDGAQESANAPWAGRAWREGTANGAGSAGAVHPARVWRELKFEHLIEAADFLNVGV